MQLPLLLAHRKHARPAVIEELTVGRWRFAFHKSDERFSIDSAIGRRHSVRELDKGWEDVHQRCDARQLKAGRHVSRPSNNARYACAALPGCPFAAAKRAGAASMGDKLRSNGWSVIARKYNYGIRV